MRFNCCSRSLVLNKRTRRCAITTQWDCSQVAVFSPLTGTCVFYVNTRNWALVKIFGEKPMKISMMVHNAPSPMDYAKNTWCMTTFLKMVMKRTFKSVGKDGAICVCVWGEVPTQCGHSPSRRLDRTEQRGGHVFRDWTNNGVAWAGPRGSAKRQGQSTH